MYKISPFKFTYKVFLPNSTGEKCIFSKVGLEFKSTGLNLITGPSGGGKTTLLNLLKGISPYHIPGNLEGEILFDSEKINENALEKLSNKIVYLFQNPFSQIIHNTPELEFAFTLENLNKLESDYQEMFTVLTEKFKLENVWKNTSDKLSNGECQKLVLASLIATGPKVILLDEPTAFLDPKARSEFYEIVNQLKKNHLIFLVDHHLNEVKNIVDQFIVVKSDGEISLQSNYSHNNINVEKLNLDGIEKSPKSKLLINDLSFKYNQKRIILNKANLILTSGEVVIIKGQNGQGKSTLFKLISQILKPNSGNIEYLVENQKLNKKDFLKSIAFVFQNPENCFFYQTLKEEFKFIPENVLEKFFSKEELERSPYLFSEGQKRRISILIYLFLNKSIFLFDEPTFGQDYEQKKRIENIVKELKNKNKIQIIISHDEEFISNIGDRVLELKNGELNEIK